MPERATIACLAVRFVEQYPGMSSVSIAQKTGERMPRSGLWRERSPGAEFTKDRSLLYGRATSIPSIARWHLTQSSP